MFNNDRIGNRTTPVEISDVVLEARRILLFVKVIENHSTTLHKDKEREREKEKEKKRKKKNVDIGYWACGSVKLSYIAYLAGREHTRGNGCASFERTLSYSYL